MEMMDRKNDDRMMDWRVENDESDDDDDDDEGIDNNDDNNGHLYDNNSCVGRIHLGPK